MRIEPAIPSHMLLFARSALYHLSYHNFLKNFNFYLGFKTNRTEKYFDLRWEKWKTIKLKNPKMNIEHSLQYQMTVLNILTTILIILNNILDNYWPTILTNPDKVLRIPDDNFDHPLPQILQTPIGILAIHITTFKFIHAQCTHG